MSSLNDTHHVESEVLMEMPSHPPAQQREIDWHQDGLILACTISHAVGKINLSSNVRPRIR